MDTLQEEKDESGVLCRLAASLLQFIEPQDPRVAGPILKFFGDLQNVILALMKM